jgi:hypothetical protein
MDDVLKEAIVSDAPLLQNDVIVPPPSSLSIEKGVGTNINLS